MSWNNWKSEGIGIKVKGAPAVSSWQEGRLDVFVRGADDHLYHRLYENDGWQGAKWEDLSDGHKIEQSPAAVSWGLNRIDLFAVWDKQLHHRACQDGKWSAWSENLEGATNDAPTAASWKMERVDVLVHTTDNFLSRRYWEKGKTFEKGSGWKGWETVGGQGKTLKNAPAAASTGPNRIDCFAHGSSDHLFHAWYQDGKQEQWAEIDTLAIKDGPAAVSASNAGQGRVDVFVRGADDLLKHRVYYAGQQAGQPAGDTIYTVRDGDWMQKIADNHKMSLQALKNLNPQVKGPLFKIYPGDKIKIEHHNAVPGYGGWETGGSWEAISTNKISSAPAAVAWWNPANLLKRIDCFAQDANNNLIHTWWK
jgi:LysM repeat protein